jgi:uncharacterized tellurite resistance protein B-like protein
MNDRLRVLYDNVAIHATADREHEAAIELLLLMMIVDHHITEDEIDEIRRISEDAGFESDTFSFDQHLGEAMAKVRSAVADGTVDELLDDIDRRVVSNMLRHSLYSAVRDVAGVDDDVTPEEQSLLGQVAVRFA